MTSYHIMVGYNSGQHKPDVGEALIAVVKNICKSPERIIAEALRVEGITVPAEYAESYREPWQDSTVRIITDCERLPDVIQFASGGGDSRTYKEAMRRAFCRLVIEDMHRQQMEVRMSVH